MQAARAAPTPHGPYAADDKADIENVGVWAGVVPLAQQQAQAPQASDDLRPSIPVPDYVHRL